MAEAWLLRLTRFTNHSELFSDLRPSFRYVMKTETWFWVSSPNSHRASHGKRCVRCKDEQHGGTSEAHDMKFYFWPFHPCVWPEAAHPPPLHVVDLLSYEEGASDHDVSFWDVGGGGGLRGRVL